MLSRYNSSSVIGYYRAYASPPIVLNTAGRDACVLSWNQDVAYHPAIMIRCGSVGTSVLGFDNGVRADDTPALSTVHGSEEDVRNGQRDVDCDTDCGIADGSNLTLISTHGEDSDDFRESRIEVQPIGARALRGVGVDVLTCSIVLSAVVLICAALLGVKGDPKFTVTTISIRFLPPDRPQLRSGLIALCLAVASITWLACAIGMTMNPVSLLLPAQLAPFNPNTISEFARYVRCAT